MNSPKDGLFTSLFVRKYFSYPAPPGYTNSTLGSRIIAIVLTGTQRPCCPLVNRVGMLTQTVRPAPNLVSQPPIMFSPLPVRENRACGNQSLRQITPRERDTPCPRGHHNACAVNVDIKTPSRRALPSPSHLWKCTSRDTMESIRRDSEHKGERGRQQKGREKRRPEKTNSSPRSTSV